MRAAVCGALALTLAVSSAPAQRITSSWDQLVTIAPIGSKVTVTRADQTRVTGTLLDINAQTITLQAKIGGIALNAPEVLRVQRTSSRRTVARLIPVAALVGGLVMLGIDSGSSNPEAASAFIAGAIMGAAAGGIVTLATPAGRVLYQQTATAHSAVESRTPVRSSPE